MAAGASGSVQVEVGGVVTLDEARVTCEDAGVRVLQCVAVCCSVLQCAAVCCSVYV